MSMVQTPMVQTGPDMTVADGNRVLLEERVRYCLQEGKIVGARVYYATGSRQV